MSGRVEKTSAAMSCVCPPDCCSPEVEKEESYVWFLIKVLFFFLFYHFHISLPTSSIIISSLSSIFFFFVKSLFKVLYGQWIVMGCLALPIIARQAKNHDMHSNTFLDAINKTSTRLTYLEEELPLVFLITFLLLLLSVPLVFGRG